MTHQDSIESLDDAAFIEHMRLFCVDHEPNGWPAVQMHQITRLCDLADENRQAVKALREELAEETYIRERLAGILADTAIALKGPEAALRGHGWHDIGELAGVLKAEVEVLKQQSAALESQLAELRHGGEAVGEVVLESMGVPGSDAQIVRFHMYKEIPPVGTKLYTQPAIPPGHGVVPLIPTRAMEEVVNQDEWQWEDLLAAAEAITEDQYNEITSAPAIQPQAAAPIAEQTDGAETAWSIAGRLALELECLLLDTKDTAIVSKWWDTAHEALEDYRLVRNAAPCDCGQFIFDRCQALKEKNPNIGCKADIQFRYKSPSSPKDCTK